MRDLVSLETMKDIVRRVKHANDELGEVRTIALDIHTKNQVEKANALLDSLMADYGILL